MKDPYEALGVDRSATDKQIKDAFKKLARKFHPDLHPGDKKAEASFKEISAANDLLKDKEKRRRFDAGEIDASGAERPQERFYRDFADGPAYASHAAQDGFASNEELEEFLSRAFAGRRPEGTFRARGQDVSYALPVGFLEAANGKPARDVTLVAAQRPSNLFVRFVIALDQIAGLLVVIAGAWLVWTRPSRMTWGFFLYVNWFNPGQYYVYYAIIAELPPLLILQEVASNLAQAAGYMGLIQFAIRAPNDVADQRWQKLERALPLIGVVLAAMLLGADATIFGWQTEFVTRAAIFAGFDGGVRDVALVCAQ